MDSSPLYSEISQQISLLIAQKKLAVGDRLPPERELAEQFGVSRACVREAIRMLSRTGLVHTQRGSGTYVASKDPNLFFASSASLAHLADCDLENLREFREMAECFIVGLAAERATEKDILMLKGIMYDQEHAVDAGVDETSAIQSFHLALARITRNPLLVALMHNLNSMLHHTREQSGMQHSLQRVQSRRGHHKIIRALEQHSVEQSRKAMLEHLQATKGEGLSVD